MNVSEIYKCMQGEGPLVGTPSILVRLSGCNLRCRWKDPLTGKYVLCDTWYTSWKAEQKEMSLQDMYNEIVRLATEDKERETGKRKNPINHIIISGGEPSVQRDELKKLISGLLVSGFHITLETNGTNYIEIPTKYEDKDLTFNLLFSISPKLASSTPTGTKHEKTHEKERINMTVLEALFKRYPSYLKFVVTGEEDLKEIKELQKQLGIPNINVYLMPEGITKETILEWGVKLADICIKHNYRYSPREHVLLWGNKRGT